MSQSTIPLVMGGASYMMRPGWRSYEQIEALTEYTIQELTLCALNQRLKLREAAIIVVAGCSDAGDAGLDLERTMAELFKIRLENRDLRTSLIKFLLALRYTPEEAIKKFEAEVPDLLDQQAQII